MPLNDGPSRIRLCSGCSARSACQVHRKVRSVAYVVHKISCLSLRRSTRVLALFSIAASVTRQSPRAVAPAVHWNIDPTRGSCAGCVQAAAHLVRSAVCRCCCIARLGGTGPVGVPPCQSYARTHCACVRESSQPVTSGRPAGRPGPRPTDWGAAPTVTLGRPGAGSCLGRAAAGRPAGLLPMRPAAVAA
jgi:hypothetical protein